MSCQICEISNAQFTCSCCKKVAYCNATCQANDWKNHQEFIGLYGEGDNVIGIETNDGVQFKITRDQALEMKTIGFLLEDVGPDNYLPLPNVDSETFKIIATFLINTKKNKVDLDIDLYFKVLTAANALDYGRLIDILIPNLLQNMIKAERIDFTDLLLYRGGMYFIRNYDDYDNLIDLYLKVKFRRTVDEEDLEKTVEKTRKKYKDIRHSGNSIELENLERIIPRKLRNVLAFQERWYVSFIIDNEYLDDIKYLVYHGLYTNERLLNLAAEKGHIEAVKALLKNENLEIFDAFLKAVDKGHLSIVRLLLEIDKRKSISRAIKSAVINGHIEIVRLLLEVEKFLPAAIDLLIIEAATYGHTEIARLLLDIPGVDPTAVENEAIQAAASLGYPEIVRLLLEKGVNPRANNNYALTRAIFFGYTEVVRLLLDHGLSFAGMNEYINNSAERGKTETIRLLVDRGFVPPPDKNFIWAAAKSGNVELVEFILDRFYTKETYDTVLPHGYSFKFEDAYYLLRKIIVERMKN
jgi:ankyrin repeat protein